jgi:phosphatidylserine/phosphatidylglycerophosphate/cardiolipin synthase-like enzyme
MKDFEYILEKVLSDKKFSRSEKEALDKVLKAGEYNHHQLAELRSKLFDHIREQFESKEERDLIDCLEGLNKALLPKAPKQQANSMAEAHFSPGFECQGAINRQMRNAKKSIDICVFTISDNQIVDEILKAHKRGIEVRIVTDDDKQHDKGNSSLFLIRKLLSSAATTGLAVPLHAITKTLLLWMTRMSSAVSMMSLKDSGKNFTKS